jgi:hypothetical protein
MDKPTPTFWRSLDTDYISTFSFVTVVTVWGLYLMFKIFNWNLRDEMFYVLFSAGISLVAFVLIIWRYIVIKRTFTTGEEVRAKVLKSDFYRDRGRVVVEFTLRGEKEKRRALSHLHTNRRTKAIKPGDWVILLVNPEKPKQTAIKNAYLDE